jgi:hypothetical protein
MPLTERFKPVVAKAHKSIFVAKNQPFHVTEFNVLDDLSKALTLVIQSRTDIFDPFIDFHSPFQAIRTQRFFLGGKVFLLGWGRDTSICDGFAMRTGDQTPVLEILVMGVVPPIGRGTMGFQGPVPIPSLQGEDGYPDQLAKIFR